MVKGIIRLGYTTEFSRISGKERGYVYFQDFIPDNDHDIRVVVIGDKAFAIKRMVRENDFRASGSGSILYEKHHFDESIIKLSFDLAEKLKTQCVALILCFKREIQCLLKSVMAFPQKDMMPVLVIGTMS